MVCGCSVLAVLAMPPEVESPELRVHGAGYQVVHGLLLESPAVKQDACLFVVC